MAYTAAGLKAHGARGLKIGVTGVARVAISFILLIFMVFIAVTPLCKAIKMKCYKLSRCYISRAYMSWQLWIGVCLFRIRSAFFQSPTFTRSDFEAACTVKIVFTDAASLGRRHSSRELLLTCRSFTALRGGLYCGKF